MFDDIVLNYAPFADFCRKLGRPLRVATMCSGTESPMLALAMLSRAVEAQGPDSVENIWAGIDLETTAKYLLIFGRF